MEGIEVMRTIGYPRFSRMADGTPLRARGERVSRIRVPLNEYIKLETA